MIGTNYFDCFLFARRFDSNHSSQTSPAGPSSAAVVSQSLCRKSASLAEDLIRNGIGLKHRATACCFGLSAAFEM